LIDLGSIYYLPGERTLTIKIFTTGGTFDKVYFDALSEFHIGDPMAGPLLEEANVTFAYSVESLLKKDSLEISKEERELIRSRVEHVSESMILITHGTDTMVDTAKSLQGIEDKTVVLFGAMQPARMRYSDAMFNLGIASAAVQILPAGIYIAMNGQIFAPDEVSKNRAGARFEKITEHTRSN
jgi:L-asparaginase